MLSILGILVSIRSFDNKIYVSMMRLVLCVINDILFTNTFEKIGGSHCMHSFLDFT